jgi:tRNA (adenine37-N6)-methyltransferase
MSHRASAGRVAVEYAALAAVTGALVAACGWWHHVSTTRALRERVAAERKGRTRAERELRKRARGGSNAINNNGGKKRNGTTNWTFAPVATARSLFVDRRGCPRQGALAPAAVGFLDVAKHIPRAAFDGLEQFSHVWVTWVFHNNTNFHKPGATQKTFKAKIRAPLLGGKKKVGLFATRSPHRPNAIGLTLCKLERVDLENGRIFLSGVDLCDGTPVLDVKPYNPHDRPASDTLRFAEWVPVDDESEVGRRGAPLRTEFQPSALDELQRLLPRLKKSGGAASKLHFGSIESAIEVITQVLCLDIRGLNQERGGDGGAYEINLGGLHVMFSVSDGVLWVDSCGLL